VAVDPQTLREMSVLALGILAGFTRATRAVGGEARWLGLEPCLRRHRSDACDPM
jgi:hypothetical protein